MYLSKTKKQTQSVWRSPKKMRMRCVYVYIIMTNFIIYLAILGGCNITIEKKILLYGKKIQQRSAILGGCNITIQKKNLLYVQKIQNVIDVIDVIDIFADCH
tara:strand:- start:27 stop:332 length:306 start_codon:yes stop_codon:yes gene_type:complete